jgi:hypothetical protein
MDNLTLLEGLGQGGPDALLDAHVDSTFSTTSTALHFGSFSPCSCRWWQSDKPGESFHVVLVDTGWVVTSKLWKL